MRRPLKPALVSLALITTAGQAIAADKVGNYATRGAGNMPCSEFVDAREEGGARYANFGGWLDGFFSGVNLFEDDTFDVAPWQSTNLLAASLARYCSQNPDIAFHVAASRLVVQLGETRLTSNSRLTVHSLEVNGKEQRVAIYDAIIRRAQERLKGLGHMTGETTAAIDERMRNALSAFQKKEGLEITGIPDQATLLMLLTDTAASN